MNGKHLIYRMISITPNFYFCSLACFCLGDPHINIHPCIYLCMCIFVSVCHSLSLSYQLYRKFMRSHELLSRSFDNCTGVASGLSNSGIHRVCTLPLRFIAWHITTQPFPMKVCISSIFSCLLMNLCRVFVLDGFCINH